MVSSYNINSQLDWLIDLFDSQQTTSNNYVTNSQNYGNNFGGFKVKSQLSNNSLSQSAKEQNDVILIHPVSDNDETITKFLNNDFLIAKILQNSIFSKAGVQNENTNRARNLLVVKLKTVIMK